MSSVTSLNQVENFTYQHLQGCMLLSLNKLTSNIKLSHSEYRVMCTLIGLYNKNYNKAFPTIEYIAKACSMGKSTVLKCLTSLVELNLLVVVKTPGKRNNYYFSNLILNASRTPHVEPQGSTPCRTTHDKQTNNKTNKINISSKNNDDNFINISDYQDLFKKLESWNFTGAKPLIKKYGIEKTKDLIKFVEDKQPQNAGAYLRALIKGLGQNINGKINFDSRMPEHGENEPLINQMIKHKFWKHKPSGKVLQVLPDVGTHLLIKYYKAENLVMFLDSGLCDKLEAFEL